MNWKVEVSIQTFSCVSCLWYGIFVLAFWIIINKPYSLPIATAVNVRTFNYSWRAPAPLVVVPHCPLGSFTSKQPLIFLSLWPCLFWTFHWSRIVRSYVVFCDWFPSLSDVFKIDPCCSTWETHSSTWLNVAVAHVLFCSAGDGHLDCCHLLPVRIMLWTFVYKFLWSICFRFLGTS